MMIVPYDIDIIRVLITNGGVLVVEEPVGAVAFGIDARLRLL